MKYRIASQFGYYITAAIVLPFYLLAMGRASLLRWPITTIAGLYMLFLAATKLVITEFPGHTPAWPGAESHYPLPAIRFSAAVGDSCFCARLADASVWQDQ